MNRLLAPILFGCVVVACGSTKEDGAANSLADPTKGTPAESASTSPEKSKGDVSDEDRAECPAPTHVGSSDELVAIANSLTWQEVSIARSSILTLSGDIIVDADIELVSTSIDKPASCKDGQCQEPLFVDYAFPAEIGPGLVAGVVCAETGPKPIQGGDTCARLTLAKGTTFRLRAVVEDRHPSGPTYWPFIEFDRPCTTRCGEREARCAATQTCFGRGSATCLYCEGKAVETCACIGADGPLADGEKCSMMPSPDQVVDGICKAGSCKPLTR